MRRYYRGQNSTIISHGSDGVRKGTGMARENGRGGHADVECAEERGFYLLKSISCSLS